MKYLNESRPRLLLISDDNIYQKNLITLITGYSFYVDYFDGLRDSIRKFRNFRHGVVLIDEDKLPRNVERFLKSFHRVQHRCLLVILSNDLNKKTRYMNAGAYDVISKTLNVADNSSEIKRLVSSYQMIVKHNLLKFSLIIGALLMPALIALLLTIF